MANVNKDFTVSELHVTSTTSYEHFDLLLNISSCSNIILSVIYCAPNTSLTDFNRDFITYIDQLEAMHINKHVQYILAEDYNIDLLHYEINQFLNIIYTHGMFSCITLPTRITDHSATPIDNIYINYNTPLAGIFVSAISDHLPIFSFLNFKKSTPKRIRF